VGARPIVRRGNSAAVTSLAAIVPRGPSHDRVVVGGSTRYPHRPSLAKNRDGFGFSRTGTGASRRRSPLGSEVRHVRQGRAICERRTQPNGAKKGARRRIGPGWARSDAEKGRNGRAPTITAGREEDRTLAVRWNAISVPAAAKTDQPSRAGASDTGPERRRGRGSNGSCRTWAGPSFCRSPPFGGPHRRPAATQPGSSRRGPPHLAVSEGWSAQPVGLLAHDGRVSVGGIELRPGKPIILVSSLRVGGRGRRDPPPAAAARAARQHHRPAVSATRPPRPSHQATTQKPLSPPPPTNVRKTRLWWKTLAPPSLAGLLVARPAFGSPPPAAR